MCSHIISWDNYYLKMSWHNSCIDMVSTQCLLLWHIGLFYQCALLWFIRKKSYHNDCTGMLFHQCVFYNALHMHYFIWKPSHNESVCSIIIYETTIIWKSHATKAALIWFLLSVRYHIIYNITIIWKFPVTITALIWCSPVCVFLWHIKCPLHKKIPS